ncbi:MAG: ATP-binding protein [Candidatus Aegiribacteria sp.]|nr:ATP-binding protein [Candidatus Aegiribacteria sp.]
MPKLIESLPFEIEARVPIQLGRESISSSVVAVSELVKNAYDADANKVIIEFHNLGQPDAWLLIQDDGEGMDSDSFANHWMRIGTDSKTDVSRSKKNRILTGSKGLGRMGIDRLCKTLTVRTKTSSMTDTIEARIDWTKYEQKGKTLSEIKHDIYRIALEETDSFPEADDHGTRLIMHDLKDEWSEDFLKVLRQELSLLVSPFEGIDDFTIELKTGIKELDGPLISPGMLESALWKLDFEVTEDGQVTARASSTLFGEDCIDGPHDWQEWLKDRSGEPRCGEFKLVLFFIPATAPGLKELSFSHKDWTTFMYANSGVRIYRDNFRVRPYGETTGKGDWLDLGLRRSRSPGGVTQNGWKIGPHQVVGAIFISRESNPELVDQTNREGIVEGDAFFDLRGAVLKAITFFEQQIHKSAVKRSEPKPTEKAKSVYTAIQDEYREKLNNAVKKASTKNQSTEGFKSLLADFSKVVTAADEMQRSIEQEIKEMQDDKDTMANLASLGILTVCFGHEAKEYTNLAAASAVLLLRAYQQGHFHMIAPYDDEFMEKIKIIKDSTEFIKTFAGFALGNVRPDKRKRTNVNLAKVIHLLFKAMDKSLRRQNIDIDCSEVEEHILPVRAFEIDLESIIVNLLTNSVTALTDTPAEKRRIVIGLKQIDAHIELTFSDSGCGIEAGTEEQIFHPIFSTKRDRKGNVEGTGMGLAIVKTFIEDHAGGSIKVIPNGSLGGAEFVIRIPVAPRSGGSGKNE